MGRRSKTSELCVWMNGEKIGNWAVTTKGHEFRYQESWISDKNTRPISLSLPLRPSEPYRGDLVSNFFENLLPDSKAIRDRLRSRFNSPSTNAFDLLTEIGRDCAGAIQLLPPENGPEELRTIHATPLDESEIATVLRNSLATGKQDDSDDFRISIAGAQEKTALLFHENRWCKPHGATPTTHIFKLPLGVAPSGVDLRTSVENEWLCAEVLKAFGIDMAGCRIAEFEEVKTLIVDRFDRRFANDRSWIARLPQEDFAQVTGTPPDKKYESDGGPGIEKIMTLLLGSQDAERNRSTFFKSQVIFWLLCAIDGHAKNFGVHIERLGRYRLTPNYDVLSAYPVLGNAHGNIAPEKARMAMAVWGKNRHYRWAEIRLPHFLQTARDCGLSDGKEIVEEVLGKTAEVIQVVEGKIPAHFPEQVSNAILSGLRKSSERLSDQTK